MDYVGLFTALELNRSATSRPSYVHWSLARQRHNLIGCSVIRNVSCINRVK